MKVIILIFLNWHAITVFIVELNARIKFDNYASKGLRRNNKQQFTKLPLHFYTLGRNSYLSAFLHVLDPACYTFIVQMLFFDHR